MPFWTIAKDGRIRLTVTVVPGASHTEIAECRADSLRIRIAAAPEKGKANDELLSFVAKRLGTRASAIEIDAGHHSRKKTILIPGEFLTALIAMGEAPSP